MAEFSHPSLFEAPARGNPLECRYEIWHQKTRIVGLPGGEEIMTLAFFILTQYRRVIDRRTDTLLSQRPALAYPRAGNKKPCCRSDSRPYCLTVYAEPYSQIAMVSQKPLTKLPYNLYCVVGDVKHCAIQSAYQIWSLAHVVLEI